MQLLGCHVLVVFCLSHCLHRDVRMRLIISLVPCSSKQTDCFDVTQFTLNSLSDYQNTTCDWYSPSCQALEEVEKNISSLRLLIFGDGEVEPNQEQVLQITLEICKEDVISLIVQNLPSLGWGVRQLSFNILRDLFYFNLMMCLTDYQLCGYR